jgi:hypothetical protein
MQEEHNRGSVEAFWCCPVLVKSTMTATERRRVTHCSKGTRSHHHQLHYSEPTAHSADTGGHARKVGLYTNVIGPWRRVYLKTYHKGAAAVAAWFWWRHPTTPKTTNNLRNLTAIWHKSSQGKRWNASFCPSVSGVCVATSLNVQTNSCTISYGRNVSSGFEDFLVPKVPTMKACR